MNERAKLSRKKGKTSEISYPSLAPNIPSFVVPKNDSNFHSATPIPEIVQGEISQEQENQESLSLKQDSPLGNINYLERVTIFRPQQTIQRQEVEEEKEEIEQGEIVQAKLNTSESAGKQEEPSIWHKVFQIQQNQGNSNIQRQEEVEEEKEDIEQDEVAQTKLTVGEAGDKYEQEADSVAAKVVEQINSPKSEQSVQGQIEPIVQSMVMRQGGVAGGTVNGLTDMMQESTLIQCQSASEREWFEHHPEPRSIESGKSLVLWNFPINDSVVQQGHREVLRQFLERNSLHFLARGVSVEVTGHASESGSSDRNEALSQERASAVARIIHRLRPQSNIHYHGLGIIGGSDGEVMARNRCVEILLPPHHITPVPERESKWRLARSILEERVGSIVGSDADLMWTPTTSAITRMMPAIPLFGRNPNAGQDVPRGSLETGRPASQYMPLPHSETVRVLGDMLESSFAINRMLNERLIRQTVDRFLNYGRAAKQRRNQRLTELSFAASQGGGRLIQADLAAYQNAERVYFRSDPTCIWRYLS